jgi:putative transposase
MDVAIAGMARKLRLEFPGAVYHVINRGNYRNWIFRDERTRAAFESCLFEACGKTGWLLHAFGIMSNHYHLALETPHGNLIGGMQWLQSTFANRFNKFRAEHGHLFQGRYKSLLVEKGSALGHLCDYIHLNPVRAGIVAVTKLAHYRDSSYWYLQHRASGPKFLCPTTALDALGLSDTHAGRRSYHEWLAWQAAEGPAGKTQAYVNLSRGWALGSDDFKAELIEEYGLLPEARAWEASGACDVREERWAAALRLALAAVGRTSDDAFSDRKSAPWKLAIAAWLKTRTLVRTRWLAEALSLGAPAALTRNLTLFRRQLQSTDPTWKRLISVSAA